MTSSLSNLSLPSIRLGAISFVNTVPIYSNYQPASHVELVYDVPANLNTRMLRGELQISPVSSACYLRNQDRFVLLDDLSVSSPGAVESVLFLSRKPLGPEMLDIPLISVPNDSETSIMLLAFLLKEATGQDLRPWFQSYDAGQYLSVLQETGNALIIGDNALMMKEARNRNPALAQEFYCYDLSTLWKERTGLPFVFAVWVANRSWAEEHPAAMAKLNRELVAARNRFFSKPSVFQTGLTLAEERSHLPKSTLEHYYRHCLAYNLEAEHQVSLRQFGVVIEAANHWESHHRERQPLP
jgi:chorismate dehydratase